MSWWDSGDKDSAKVKQLENQLAQERKKVSTYQAQVGELEGSLGSARRELADYRLVSSSPQSSPRPVAPLPPMTSVVSDGGGQGLRARLGNKELEQERLERAHQEIEALQAKVEALERGNAELRQSKAALQKELQEKEQHISEWMDGHDESTSKSQPAAPSRRDSVVSQMRRDNQALVDEEKFESDRLREEKEAMQRRVAILEAELDAKTREIHKQADSVQENAEMQSRVATLEAELKAKALEIDELMELLESKQADQLDRTNSPRNSLASEISLSEDIDEDADPVHCISTSKNTSAFRAATEFDPTDFESKSVRSELLQLESETHELRRIVGRKTREVSGLFTQNMQLKQELTSEAQGIKDLIQKLEMFTPGR